MKTQIVTFALLALNACGGTSPAPLDNDAGPFKPVPNPNADAGSDSATTADSAVTPSIAKHCNISPATPDVCIENVEGHAGDVVDVELYLVADPNACSVANEAGGHILFDPNLMTVDNPVEQVDCRTRRVSPSIGVPGATVIQWDAFGPGTLGGCTKDLPLGKIDVVKMRILPTTKPGDYELKFEDAGFIGYTAQCANTTGGISGTLRVLP